MGRHDVDRPPLPRRQRSRHDARELRERVDRHARERRDADPLRDEPLDGDEVVGLERDAGLEPRASAQLEQVAAADGNYSVTVEFLDVAGNVVATATEQSGPIKKGAKKEVSFKGAGEKIYGYRYKPIK